MQMNANPTTQTEYGSKEHYEKMLKVCMTDLETAKANEDIHLALDVYANTSSLVINAYMYHKDDKEFLATFEKRALEVRNNADTFLGELMKEEYGLELND